MIIFAADDFAAIAARMREIAAGDQPKALTGYTADFAENLARLDAALGECRTDVSSMAKMAEIRKQTEDAVTSLGEQCAFLYGIVCELRSGQLQEPAAGEPDAEFQARVAKFEAQKAEWRAAEQERERLWASRGIMPYVNYVKTGCDRGQQAPSRGWIVRTAAPGSGPNNQVVSFVETDAYVTISFSPDARSPLASQLPAKAIGPEHIPDLVEGNINPDSVIYQHYPREIISLKEVPDPGYGQFLKGANGGQDEA